MTSVLTREPVKFDGAVVFEKAVALGSEELRKQAEQLFSGYHDIEPDYRYGRRSLRQDFLKVMKSLGIEPYTEQSVLDYKERLQARLWWRNLPAEALEAIAPVVAAGGFVCTFICLFIASVLTVAGFTFVSWWGYIGLSCIFLFGLGLMLLALVDSGKIKVSVVRWENRDIRQSWKTMPEFALQTAADIRTRCPSVKLYVEEAFLRQRSVDPFLIAVAGSDVYYQGSACLVVQGCA